MTPDWTLLRSFLTVAEAGSLSAAARVLHLTQPTLGRHIAELEAQLGTQLFTRSPQGLTPTETALALLPPARQMREAAARLSLAAAGRQESLQGTVRLTASRVVSHHILPPMLARLRQQEPGIEIELVPSDTPENLLFREADIALRMFRPTQEDVVTRHLADLPMGLYAAKTYLDRRGRPQSPEDMAAHDLIGMDRSDLVQRMLDFLKIPLKRGDFPVRCDDQLVYLNLMRAGLGIGGALRLIGDADPLLEPIAFLNLPALPVWLTAPEALRQTPRIRRTLDHLAAEFLTLLDPGAPKG
ncbi:LysR family transcriptional regulator [Stagnihabitans tardus]|uniref:LysR family transcriptional regulator n=1 Tax=Stagnihabitans tardus TaxID=2699202 RepID=A0AAE4YCF2_9RHOB|nr:LysR family transcriptional regulator [Stagnihabitans tardus]NBZ87385.1 LysR family transcriptional regulator [Stagnihabitans tardus]